MFTQISWSSYITIVVVLLAGYYFFVGFWYYRDNLLQLLSGRKITAGDTVNFTAQHPLIKPEQSLHQANVQEVFEKQNLFQLTQSLSDEIQAFLNEAGRNKIHKGDVIYSLQLLLAKYPALKDSSFREFIQNLIETECETNCSIHLSDEELSVLWN